MVCSKTTMATPPTPFGNFPSSWSQQLSANDHATNNATTSQCQEHHSSKLIYLWCIITPHEWITENLAPGLLLLPPFLLPSVCYFVSQQVRIQEQLSVSSASTRLNFRGNECRQEKEEGSEEEQVQERKARLTKPPSSSPSPSPLP